VQLFDLETDPGERIDRADDPEAAATRARLEAALAAELYGEDAAWAREGRLKGFPAPAFAPSADRGLAGQRGLHHPPPPLDDPANVVGTA
jgi:hypothetical protein